MKTTIAIGLAVAGVTAASVVAGHIAPTGNGSCQSREGLPDPVCTPGMADRSKTAAVLCAPGYTTRSVRPAADYTDGLKQKQMVQYGRDGPASAWEEDHLIPLTLGGDPRSPLNLWPQAWLPVDGWGAHAKDRLEVRMHQLVCSGGLDLAEAQSLISEDWIRAYQRFIGPSP